MTPARRRHVEAAGPRPVDQIADQRRLVAIGQRIDDAGLARLLRQHRPGERIRLDIDHNDRLAVAARQQDMLHARRRIAGGVDHQIDRLLGEQRLDIVGNPCGAGAERRAEIGRPVALGRPADARQILPRPGRVQVCDGGDVDARRPDRLGQEHRGELAAADNPDPDGPVLRIALQQEAVKVHAAYSAAT